MDKNILIILNTDYHVEVALSVYKSLTLIGYKPTIFIIRPDLIKYGLLNYLFENKIDFITDYVPGICRQLFSKAIVVSAYPTIEIPEGIPRRDYPIFEEFQDKDIILIAHRTGMEQNLINKVLCVTPLAEKYNFDHIYLCENPSERDQMLPLTYPVTFLIQGNFFANRRDLFMVDKFLDTTKIPNDKYKFVFIGDNHGKLLLRNQNHSSVIHLQGLNETLFYESFNNAHFILPLISEYTAHSTYIVERLSSSLSLSFCFNKPMLIDKDIHEIYKSPSITYSGSNDFIKNVEFIINKINPFDYMDMVESCRDFKTSLRLHNAKTLYKTLIS